MTILKKYSINPKTPKVLLDSWQQWQLEYFGNPIYAQKGIRLGQAFIDTFYAKQKGELFADIARLPNTVASLLIIDYLIDHTDYQAQQVAKIQKEFVLGDPVETEGVIVGKVPTEDELAAVQERLKPVQDKPQD
jgi:hypothetical protein